MSVDLSTKYLGLQLSSPLVIAACPLTRDPENLRRLEAAGAAAAVLPSLFEEQFEHDEVELSGVQDMGTESFAESLTYFPEPADYHSEPESYLDDIGAAKRAVSMPIIASLNGTSTGGWVHYAKQMQEAGADAVELNISFIAADIDVPGQEIEKQYLDLIAAVKQSVSIPLAVKIDPSFSSLGNMAKRMAEAGADGLVLFNRLVQPDFDLDEMEVSTALALSTPDELATRLRWIAILHKRVAASIAATGGIHCGSGLLKALLAGADVGMVASSLYKHGVEYVETILGELRDLMEQKEYESVEQLKGSMSRENCPNPSAFARGNYMKALTSFVGPTV